MQPDYFHNKLTFYEAMLYVSGMEKRQRSAWEQTRLLANIVAAIGGSSDGAGIDYPWDKDAETEECLPPSAEECAELMREKERWMNSLNNNDEL